MTKTTIEARFRGSKAGYRFEDVVDLSEEERARGYTGAGRYVIGTINDKIVMLHQYSPFFDAETAHEEGFIDDLDEHDFEVGEEMVVGISKILAEYPQAKLWTAECGSGQAMNWVPLP